MDLLHNLLILRINRKVTFVGGISPNINSKRFKTSYNKNFPATRNVICNFEKKSDTSNVFIFFSYTILRFSI